MIAKPAKPKNVDSSKTRKVAQKKKMKYKILSRLYGCDDPSDQWFMKIIKIIIIVIVHWYLLKFNFIIGYYFTLNYL